MRALIVSDIHANLPALEAVFHDATQAGSWDEVWCLGDTIGYGAQPNECLDRLRQERLRIVVGNHDLAASGKLELDLFNTAAAAAAEWTSGVLSPESRAMIESMPERETWESFTLVHGSPREPVWEYITSSFVAAANFSHFSTPYCLVGHTHVPAVFLWDPEMERCLAYDFPPGNPLMLGDHRMIINPGSVGQPRNGEPRASYAILDSERGELYRRTVDYPIEETQALIRQAGLPRSLADRLAMGW